MNKALVHIVDILVSIFKIYVAYYAYVIHNSVSYGIMIYLLMTLIMIIACKPFFKIDITSPFDIQEQVNEIREGFFENYWRFFFPVSLSIALGTYVAITLIGTNGFKLW